GMDPDGFRGGGVGELSGLAAAGHPQRHHRPVVAATGHGGGFRFCRRLRGGGGGLQLPGHPAGFFAHEAGPLPRGRRNLLDGAAAGGRRVLPAKKRSGPLKQDAVAAVLPGYRVEPGQRGSHSFLGGVHGPAHRPGLDHGDGCDRHRLVPGRHCAGHAAGAGVVCLFGPLPVAAVFAVGRAGQPGRRAHDGCHGPVADRSLIPV
ncbi:MAG: hypothetical protein AVDCRST_MAG56-5999, partial [uncultured Cytophagales bacterium]